ncbi:MAG: DMT family transporter [Chloroflexi bacterium]|nr:DMT family transporter [Chloroflexota bacterium]MBV9544884.1 DMT family transporter [Chloroflexota bacterium]
MSLGAVEFGELAGLISALAWAATGLLVRAHGASIHAIVINALRCTTAGLLFLVAWPFASSRAPVPPAAWLFLGTSLVLGLGIGDSLYFEALKRIGVARAMPISMGYPVLAAIGAVILLHESLGALAAVGILLTLGGVYLVALPSRGAVSVASRREYWVGVALAAAAAVGWCCSTLALGPAMQLVDVATASAIRVPLVGALLWVAATRANVLPTRSQFGPHAVAAIAGTGLLSVAATAFFLQSVALAGAGRAAVLSATSPMFAVPFSVAFLGERGSWRLAAGTLCSVVGVVLLAQT